MKKHYCTLLSAFLSIGLLCVGEAAAQQIRTAYFMDKTTVRLSMNPAFQPERGFVAIPGAGSLFAEFGTNGLALGDVLYPRGGRLVTFMDPSVDAQDFLSRVRSNNRIHTDIATDIASAGWFAGRGFWTIGIGVRGSVSADIPKSLFEFIKLGNGTGGTRYDVDGLRAYGDAFVEASVGYSHPLGRKWTLGGTVKFLAGGANMDVRFDHLTAELDGERWKIDSRGEMLVSMKGLRPKFTQDNEGKEYIDGFKLSSPGVGGYGAAIDLGVTFKPVENLTLSAAVLDLGLTCWDQSATVRGIADGSFYFDGFKLPIGDDEGGESVGDQFDALQDDLGKLFHFSEVPSKSRTTMLTSTINAGAEYALARNRVSFGLLSSTHLYKPKAYTELTLSVNYRPIYWFAASLSYSFLHSDFQTFGFALNFSPSWINFFLGTDYMFTRITPQAVPIDAHVANLYFGLSVPLGRQRTYNRYGFR